MLESTGELRPMTPNDYSFAIVNKDWDVSQQFSRIDISKGKATGMIAALVSDMVGETIMQPWRNLLTTLEAGNSTACYDGQYFFDTDHVDVGADYATAQDNDLTQAITAAATPTVANIKASFELALAALAGFKGDTGKVFHSNPVSGLVGVVPFSWRAVVKEAFLDTMSSK